MFLRQTRLPTPSGESSYLQVSVMLSFGEDRLMNLNT